MKAATRTALPAGSRPNRRKASLMLREPDSEYSSSVCSECVERVPAASCRSARCAAYCTCAMPGTSAGLMTVAGHGSGLTETGAASTPLTVAVCVSGGTSSGDPSSAYLRGEGEVN